MRTSLVLSQSEILFVPRHCRDFCFQCPESRLGIILCNPSYSASPVIYSWSSLVEWDSPNTHRHCQCALQLGARFPDGFDSCRKSVQEGILEGRTLRSCQISSLVWATLATVSCKQQTVLPSTWYRISRTYLWRHKKKFRLFLVEKFLFRFLN
jgi:hypothetical protein